ncbi:MAG TPA: hypothetical protein VNQ78_18725 [Paracoccus sp. (in: a-proteobacteria)]|uniref:hypothetical protein n=1 Tax=Paracoccus sp. TaxID=267 RepID=UPI002CA25852|nr:hypothetical protein [Paracoccus sp. (in: a-proteobacteria)]HWL58692.1 hypothetical protein [Paracoccus sp. (in: a-proteobacteria)]
MTQMTASVETILSAVGEIIREERERHDAELAKVRQIAVSKDSASLLKGTFGALLSANLTALRAVCDHTELRRSEVISGEASALITAALNRGNR